jgi:hypothetical protein
MNDAIEVDHARHDRTFDEELEWDAEALHGKNATKTG